MKKAVIFDMDGVLSDSEYIYVEKILEMLEEEGIRIEAVEISDLFGQSMIHLCTELKRRYGLNKEASVYRDRVHELRDRHIEEKGLYPMEGAVELVRSLHKRGIPIAVASSAPLKTIRGNMDHFGIGDCIDGMVSGLECSQGKPDPEIYLKAAALLHTAPSDCLVIEDSSNGVAAAKNAGMTCYAFVPPKAVPQDISRADTVLTSFTDLDPDRLLGTEA